MSVTINVSVIKDYQNLHPSGYNKLHNTTGEEVGVIRFHVGVEEFHVGEIVFKHELVEIDLRGSNLCFGTLQNISFSNSAGNFGPGFYVGESENGSKLTGNETVAIDGDDTFVRDGDGDAVLTIWFYYLNIS